MISLVFYGYSYEFLYIFVSVKLTPSSQSAKHEINCLKTEAVYAKLHTTQQRRENTVLAETL